MVDGAHESSAVHDIPADLHSRISNDRGEERTAVESIDALVERAGSEGRLFSELGVPWAQPGRVVSMRDYTSFPQRRGIA